MLEIKNLYSGYQGTDVIRDITLKADRGEVLCIVGPNGCGKTTLLKSIAHIIPYRGLITIDSREVSSFTRKNLAKKIALLGQTSELYFPYSIYDTVALGRYAHSEGFLRGLSKEDDVLIRDIIKKLELYDEKDRMISELSGGQLQRVFLARTLVQNPDLILLDEPTNHLDLKHQVELLHYLTNWAKENNKTVIGVLHDLNLVHHFGDTVAVMDKGKLTSAGKPEAVLDGETLRKTYGMDIRQFMLESLENWKNTGAEKTEGGTI
ncbi:MAG: ABC transporter ATP-binding protein [Spirochaetaceae bacterium]|jgi:iron complex transport system ATP-binding protein|nr:ABC transporter ATP-binding protein [Spirochaetaceae bacterium]